MDAPEFDPSQPFDTSSDHTPEFDPSQPFEKEESPSLGSRILQGTLYGIGKVGHAIDSYGGDASTRAAIYAAQTGQPIGQAFKNAYGNSDAAPTGRQIALQAGVPDEPLPDAVQDIGRFVRDETPIGTAYNQLPEGLRNRFENTSQADVAGLGVDLAASPLNFLSSGIKGASSLSDLVKNSVLGRQLESGANALGRGAAHVGELVTGVPVQDIKTYANRADDVKNLMNESGWNIPEAADIIREKYQNALRDKKTELGGDIQKAIDASDSTPTISTTPIINRLETEKNKLNDVFQSGDKAQLDDIISKVHEASVPEYFQEVIPNALKSNPSAGYARRILGMVNDLAGKDAAENLSLRGKNLLQFLIETLESHATPNGVTQDLSEGADALKAAGKDYVKDGYTYTLNPTTQVYEPKFKTRVSDPAYWEGQNAKFNELNQGESPMTYRDKLQEILKKAQEDPVYRAGSAASDAKQTVIDQSLHSLDQLSEWANDASQSDFAKKVGAKLDEKTNVNYLNMIKNYLQDRAGPSYMKDGQIFQTAPMAANIAKKGAATAREILNQEAPAIAAANEHLSNIHKLDDVIPDRLIAPGKPEAGLLAAGAGLNQRSVNNLKEAGNLTGQDFLSDAQLLSAGRRFYNPSWSPVDTTGKAVYRVGAGGGLGAMAAHTLGLDPKIGFAAGAAMTSPAALKLGIDAARAAKNLGGAVGEAGANAFNKLSPSQRVSAYLTAKALGASNSNSSPSSGSQNQENVPSSIFSNNETIQAFTQNKISEEHAAKQLEDQYGQYAPVILKAAKEGPKSLSIIGTILQRNPDFRKQVGLDTQ